MPDDFEIIRQLKTQEESFIARMTSMPHPDEIASYSNRFLVFLDILGFKDVVSEIAATSPNDLFHIIVDSYWFHSAAATVNFQLISDSIIISSKDDEPSSFISVANAANALRNSFLERGLLVRGAISFGQHFQKDGICISPVLIEAYELESRFASNPRIVCAQSTLDRVLPSVTTNQKGRRGIIGPLGFHVVREQLPIPDADGLMVMEFLPDTLEAYFLRTGHHHDPFYTPSTDQLRHFREVGPQVLARWRDGLVSAQLRCKATAHKQKVDYLVRKWNQYILSFKELTTTERSAFLL